MMVSEESSSWSALQRVILPSADQTDTIPLYVDAGPARYRIARKGRILNKTRRKVSLTAVHAG